MKDELPGFEQVEESTVSYGQVRMTRVLKKTRRDFALVLAFVASMDQRQVQDYADGSMKGG